MPNYSSGTVIQVLRCLMSNDSTNTKTVYPSRTRRDERNRNPEQRESAHAQLLEWGSDSIFWDPPRQTRQVTTKTVNGASAVYSSRRNQRHR